MENDVLTSGKRCGKTLDICIEYAQRSWKIDYEALQKRLTEKYEAQCPRDVCHTRGEYEAYRQAILACKSILSGYNKNGFNRMRG